ncbi:MAG: hypothetical protein AABY22_15400 [Nanoarchaeota archaeon]
MAEEKRTYVVYEYVDGFHGGERFYQHSGTNLEKIIPGLMRRIDKIPDEETAKRLCRNVSADGKDIFLESFLMTWPFNEFDYL